jgi:hypothetical protein
MMNGFDPSKMDPKVMMQMADLVRQLPPDKISKMQTLMHNMMAGFDVQKDMEEFEKTLPPGFRETLVSIMGSSNMGNMGGMPGMTTPHVEASKGAASAPSAPSATMGIRDARLTLLRAVAESRMSPEEAERLLFPE